MHKRKSIDLSNNSHNLNSSKSSSIDKGLVIYRRTHRGPGFREKAIKYGLHLNLNQHDNYSPQDRKLFRRLVRGQGRKRVAIVNSSCYLPYFQGRVAQDLEEISGMRRFDLDFDVGSERDFYRSESAIDSQYTVHTEGSDDDSDNELDLEIQAGSEITQKNKRGIKKIFKQAKRVTNFSLDCQKIDENQNQAFHYLPLMNLLEDCHIKIKVRAPTDILALRDLLKAVKRRNHFPNMKSLVIELRHSYNKENCSSKFIRFCKSLQEISEITQDLAWMKIQLKVKYMWRLDESAILALKQVLQRAQDQLIKLSFVGDQPTRLKALFKTIEGMGNLNKFSVRFNELSDIENANAMKELTESLKKIQSLRRLKIKGKDILDKEQNEKVPASEFITNFGDFSQITSFNFQERNQFIDETLWNCFANSIFKLPQLRVLVLRIHTQALEMSPSLNGFLEFFVGLKNLHNLRIFNFDIRYDSCRTSRIDGRKIFQAACAALQNQKELRKLNFHYPWIPKMNSDLQEFTKVLPNLQKLEDFSLTFADLKFIEPVENDVFTKFTKALVSLKAIQFVSIDPEIKKVNNLTYEAAYLLSKRLETRIGSLCMRLQTKQADGEAVKDIRQFKGIAVWKDGRLLK